MSILTLEAGGELREHRCDHCREVYQSTFGFIYRDEDAYAVYHVALYARHPDRRASLAITIRDDWSDDVIPAECVSVALRVRPTEDEVVMTVIDGSESPWATASTHPACSTALPPWRTHA